MNARRLHHWFLRRDYPHHFMGRKCHHFNAAAQPASDY